MADAVAQIAALDDPSATVVESYERPNGLRCPACASPRRRRDDLRGAPQRHRRGERARASRPATPSSSAAARRRRARTPPSSRVIARRARRERAPARRRAGRCRSTDREAVRALVQQPDRRPRHPARRRGAHPLRRRSTRACRSCSTTRASATSTSTPGADVEMATRLAVNGKLSRPGVCNALECLLVDAARRARGSCRPSPRALLDGRLRAPGRRAHARARPGGAAPRRDDDWGHEFLDTSSPSAWSTASTARSRTSRATARATPRPSARATTAHAARWRREVDAACVVVNASHALPRRRRARPRRGDRHRDEPAPLARPDGARGADDDEMAGGRNRASSRVSARPAECRVRRRARRRRRPGNVSRSPATVKLGTSRSRRTRGARACALRRWR